MIVSLFPSALIRIFSPSAYASLSFLVTPVATISYSPFWAVSFFRLIKKYPFRRHIKLSAVAVPQKARYINQIYIIAKLEITCYNNKFSLYNKYNAYEI